MEEFIAKNTDITTALMVFLKIANIVGLCPLQKQQDKVSKLFYMRLFLFVCFLIVAYLMGVFKIREASFNETSEDDIALTIVFILEVFGGLITTIISLTIPLKCSQWKFFMKSVIEKQDQTKINAWVFFYKILGTHLLANSCYAYLVYWWFFSPLYELPTIEASLMSAVVTIRWYHHFIITHILWESAETLKAEYKYLEIKVMDNFESYGSITNISKLRIREIKSTYVKLNELTKTINQIFGIPLFGMLCYNVIALLNLVIWANNGVKNGQTITSNEHYKVHLIVAPTFFMIHTVFLVMACDKVEQAGRNLINACFLLQDRIDKSDRSDELTYLIQFFKGLVPKISAAELFVVNRKLLSTLFSLITTHTIVLLQFRK